MNLSMVLFLIGILGFILNRKNIILLLISIEIMLLAVTKRVFVILWLFLALHQLLNGPVDNTLMWAMSPWFITGITDCDGSFSFSILKDSASIIWLIHLNGVGYAVTAIAVIHLNDGRKMGFRILPVFVLCAGINPAALLTHKPFFWFYIPPPFGGGLATSTLEVDPSKDGRAVPTPLKGAGCKKKRNYQMLLEIKQYFGDIGHITKTGDTYHYVVSGLANCLAISVHFLNYPLITYKVVYFSMWYDVLLLMKQGAHLTEAGLLRIVCIKAAFKGGLNALRTVKY